MISGSKTRLRDRRLADALDNYMWRTDPELAQLDAAPLLTVTLSEYLADYSSELRYVYPNDFQFAIETLDGKHIGNCLYYNLDESKGEAELGIMIGDRDYWDKGYGTDVVTTLVSYVFRKQTDIKRIFLKTLDTNTRAQRCFKKCGFTQKGHLSHDGYHFVLMQIQRKQWEKSQQK